MNYSIIQRTICSFFIFLCSSGLSYGMEQCLLPTHDYAFLYTHYDIEPLIKFPAEIQTQIFSQLFSIPLYDEIGQLPISNYGKNSVIYSAAFTHNNSSIAVGTHGEIFLVDVTKGTFSRTDRTFAFSNTTALLSDNETNVLIGGTDGLTINIYPLEKKTGEFNKEKENISIAYTLPLGAERFRPIYYITQTPQGDILFGNEWGEACLLNRKTNTVENLFNHPDGSSVASICFRSDIPSMACAYRSGKVEMIDLVTHKKEPLLDAHKNPIEAYQSLCFSHDNKCLIVLYKSGITLLDVSSKQIYAQLEDTKQCVFAHFSPTDELILVGDNAGRVRIFKHTTKSCITRLPVSHEITAPFGAVFSSDGNLLALRSRRFLSLWKFNLLAAYLLSKDVTPEQALYIKFLRDITFLISEGARLLCKEAIVKEKLQSTLSFLIKQNAALTKVLYSFDKPVRTAIRQQLLIPNGINHLFKKAL